MRALRWSVVGFCLGLGLAVVQSCGAPACGPASCKGCCDEAMSCHPGSEAAACGVSGSQCIACGTNDCLEGVCFRGRGLPAGADAGDDGGFELDGGSWTIDDYCRQTVPADCDYFVRCGRADSRPGCVDYFGRFTALAVCGVAERAAIKNGRTVFDPARAEACSAYTGQTAACDTGVPPAGPGCDQIFFGNVGDGSPCFETLDCATTSYCTATAATCPGTCAPRKPVGQAAASDGECQSGLYVYLGACAQPVATGGSCAPMPPTVPTKQRCVAGSFCNASNTCQADLAAGQLCDAAQQVCAGGLPCVNRTCTAWARLGQACGGASGVPCELDLHCSSAQYRAAGTCATAVDVDGGCFETVECRSTLFCSGAVLAQADGGSTHGACVPLQGQGSPCRPTTGPSECQPGLYCSAVSAQCAPLRTSGQSCAAGQCAAGLACDGGSCQAAGCVDPAP